MGPENMQGFIKTLIAPDDTILGFTALGPNTGELLPVVQLAMAQKLPYTAIQDLILVHPTIGEGLTGLFDAVPPK
jgi:pyruvate/2-oxoglutarate dehydrogenase complex dihydrolipoamide dehydrogenase (E3) component